MPQLQAAFHGDHGCFPYVPGGRPGPSAPSRCSLWCFNSALVRLPSERHSRRPTWKRKRGRCPPARLPTTRRETSGYNTGPGRCSDPSCLVLQPEGRRSAAEPAPRPRGTRQREGRWVCALQGGLGAAPPRTPARSPCRASFTPSPRWVPRAGCLGRTACFDLGFEAALCSSYAEPPNPAQVTTLRLEGPQESFSPNVSRIGGKAHR